MHPASTPERCTGPPADAELNSSLRLGYRHDGTSSAVTGLFKVGNAPSQASAPLGQGRGYHPTSSSGLSFATAVG